MKKIFLGAIILGVVGLITSSLMTQGQTSSIACKTFNMAGWTQDQKNSIPIVSQRVLEKPPFNTVLRVSSWSNQTGQICFTSILDVGSMLTEQNYLTEYGVWQNEIAVATAAEQAKSAEIDLERKTNDFCFGELAELDLRVDTIKLSVANDLSTASTLAEMRTALGKMNNIYAVGFKKLARCLRTLRR